MIEESLVNYPGSPENALQYAYALLGGYIDMDVDPHQILEGHDPFAAKLELNADDWTEFQAITKEYARRHNREELLNSPAWIENTIWINEQVKAGTERHLR